jgi:hypothetical protein
LKTDPEIFAVDIHEEEEEEEFERREWIGFVVLYSRKFIKERSVSWDQFQWGVSSASERARVGCD